MCFSIYYRNVRVAISVVTSLVLDNEIQDVLTMGIKLSMRGSFFPFRGVGAKELDLSQNLGDNFCTPL